MSHGNKDVGIDIHGAHRGNLTQNQSKDMIRLHGRATVPNVGHEAAKYPTTPIPTKTKDTTKAEERKVLLLTADLPEINGQEQQLGG